MDFDNDKFTQRLEDISSEMVDRYAYIKSVAKYYWIDKKRFYRPNDVCSNLMVKESELR